jgi:hypothetical protein
MLIVLVLAPIVNIVRIAMCCVLFLLYCVNGNIVVAVLL